MESIRGERSSHPSVLQLEMLVDFLEKKPDIAKGFSRNASAKARAQMEWERLAPQLNSIGGGTIKTAKKWIKYWSDKKSAVKKKAAARVAANRRTGGGAEEGPELSVVEERILSIMGGEGFATGDRHLQIQQFSEQSQDSPSLIQNQHNIQILQMSTSTNLPPANPPSPVVEIQVIDTATEPPPPHQYQSQSRVEVDIDATTPSLHFSEEIREERSGPSATSTRPHARQLVFSPGHRGDVPQIRVTTPRRLRRGRAVQASPPSQRRSQFISVTEKFLRLEEARLALDRRVVTVMEQNAHREVLMTQALITMGEGMKALAEVIDKNK